jgi:hypothetical protein
MRAALQVLFGCLQVETWLLLIAASVHLLRAASWAAGRAMKDETPPLDGELPLVTVQLPIRNERAVAERVMRAACALDWPGERLQVQVLDDSDDETSAIIDRTAEALRAEGHDIVVSRRADRTGFKAGNLQSGLDTARGEYLAVFDADSQPPRDFLRRTIPHLVADAYLAFVQARWSFDNERRNLITRVQALILHGLFTVEQSRLSDSNKPLQFNGTSGVWRASALRAAGGWLPSAGASVTEDLDLSFRVQLRGLRGKMLPTLTVETELPSTMAAFRAQQARWVRGSAEALRALGKQILFDAPAASAKTSWAPARSAGRVAMIAHLVRHARQPALVLFMLGWPVIVLARLSPLLRWGSAAAGTTLAKAGPVAVGGKSAALAKGAATSLALADLVPRFDVPWAWPLVVLLLYLAVSFYYGAALERIGRKPIGAFVLAPFIMALSIGLCIRLSIALFAGLFAGAGEFIRTPKGGAYRARRDLGAVIEIVLGLGYLALAGLSAMAGEYLLAASLVVFFGFGLSWVGLGSLIKT